ncbi:hypothetical protein [Pseudovibrio sp. SPO723]|uniref:hypothetical protein n=1 Tax=Nesiotobacter zosterae TaxID=392721 RepID=UPI0029C5CCE6|nr:hypothetical protein [Pseudovibrio sp. SPO723]MDX5593396.1 hypothetical protein [Pseudovibrio sp. SPO723]
MRIVIEMKLLKNIFNERHKLLGLREFLAYVLSRNDKKVRFKGIASKIGSKDRVFILGNGPSLNQHDMNLLKGEDYFLCNHAERMKWTRDIVHPYYIATDPFVVKGLSGGEIHLKAQNYFIDESLCPGLSENFISKSSIFWCRSASGGSISRGLTKTPWVSLPGGSTVLISAAQVAVNLGYKNVYILGCDLNYSGDVMYSYDKIAASPNMRKSDRSAMVKKTNLAFDRIAREAMKRGVLIANATPGGNLNSLPRVSFEGLFSEEKIAVHN